MLRARSNGSVGDRLSSKWGLGRDLYSNNVTKLSAFPPQMPTLSSEELEAERIYYGLCSWSLTKRAFVIVSKDLEAHSPEAGAYLRWLILRGQAWPRVA